MTYMDTFGKALMVHHLDNSITDYLVERDDGFSDVLSLDAYFTDYAQFPEDLKVALKHVSGRVLDIGCGAGKVILYLQDRFHVVGMDISHVALQVCQLRGARYLVNAHAPHIPFGKNEVERAIDGYKGVTPRFVYDRAHQKELIVMWGWSKMWGEMAKEKATKAVVLRFTVDRIVALEVTESEEWIYSFYPKHGVGLFARNSGIMTPVTAVFHSKCEFEMD